MLERLHEWLRSGLAILLLGAWLVCAIAVATWVVGVTDIELRRKGAVGLVVLIFLAPIGIGVAVDEFVIRRIRYGPSVPGRRKRGT
jgi:hypothetical protein